LIPRKTWRSPGRCFDRRPKAAAGAAACKSANRPTACAKVQTSKLSRYLG
jgi:hypothetical protein